MTKMFIAALFTIARTWKQPKCPSSDECSPSSCCEGLQLLKSRLRPQPQRPGDVRASAKLPAVDGRARSKESAGIP